MLYVHLKNPVKSEAVLLPPLNELPVEALLLNTGDVLEWSSDVLPAFWQNNAQVLRIKRLPREAIASGETLVIKLRFQQPVIAKGPEVLEFEG